MPPAASGRLHSREALHFPISEVKSRVQEASGLSKGEEINFLEMEKRNDGGKSFSSASLLFRKEKKWPFFFVPFFFQLDFFLYTEIFCYTHTRARTRAH